MWREYFLDKMSHIHGDRRSVCIRFMEFLRSAVDPSEACSLFTVVNRILQDEFDAIDGILRHQFWNDAAPFQITMSSRREK